jgi:hypothetical protein
MYPTLLMSLFGTFSTGSDILSVFSSCFMNYEVASSTELSTRKMVSVG